jgi:prolyl-tRNA synthetase
MGLRDIENNSVEVARRDTGVKEVMPIDGLPGAIAKLLDDIQTNIYSKASVYRDEHITVADSWDEFVKLLDEKGGFISAHWDGTSASEERIKDETKATIRCIPLNNKKEEGKCILTGNPSAQRVLFARAY